MERAVGLVLALWTWKGYSAMSIEFQEFRKLVNLDSVWLVPVDHLQQFIVYLNRKGLAPGRLSALAFHARLNGYEYYSSDYHIKKIIKGWSKERGRVQAVSYTHLTLPTKA